MKHTGKLLFLGGIALLLNGCFSLTDKSAPEVPVPDLAAVQQKSTDKTKQKKPTFSMPDTLGGVVSSDNWIVHQDTHEEEFEGNVSYDNGAYIFNAQYVRSQRDKNTIFAKGSVYLRKNETDGTWYELHADQVSYNYQTGKGYALSTTRKLAKAIYHSAQGEIATAQAKRMDFNTQTEIYELTGKAVITQTDLQNQTVTLKANRILAKQKEQYALLQEQAQAANEDYTLSARSIEYDGLTHQARATGERPLAQGDTENGTFAIIADEVSADTQNRQLHLQGQVQGWVVSEQISSSGANKTL